MGVNTGASPPENLTIVHYSSEDIRRIALVGLAEIARRNEMTLTEVLSALLTEAQREG